jgi:hypothetical protein
MKHAKVTAAGFTVLSVTIAGLAFAQPAAQPTGDTPQVNRRVQAQVDRMMANDKNGDSKLERDELPARLADRLFAADADQDGYLTPEELLAHFSGQAPSGTAPAGDTPATDADRPGQPGASAHDVFEGAMKQAGGTMRAIRGSEFGPETRDSDLDAAQSMQEAMVAAKSSYTAVGMSPMAAEQFGTDEAAYRTAFRMALIESLRAAIDIEQAVLEGDPQAALAARTRLMDSQEAAHNLFQE